MLLVERLDLVFIAGQRVLGDADDLLQGHQALAEKLDKRTGRAAQARDLSALQTAKRRALPLTTYE